MSKQVQTQETVVEQNQVNMNVSNIPSVNYEAIEYLGWFNSDVQNVQSLGHSIFRGAMMLNDPRVVEMKSAFIKALDELQDDINKLRGFLKI